MDLDKLYDLIRGTQWYKNYHPRVPSASMTNLYFESPNKNKKVKIYKNIWGDFKIKNEFKGTVIRITIESENDAEVLAKIISFLKIFFYGVK